MSEIFNDLQEAPGIGFPVSLQIKLRRLLVSLFIVTGAIGTPAATAHKLRTPVVGRQKVYSSPRSELTASLGGPEHQAQGLRESRTALLANPLIPEQAGANQLRVSYEDGKLTIIAENSLLSDVLSAVRAQTGADIELPPGASSQRIWARLGPGPARSVLATLLDSTNLDYVIRASETDPQSIHSILLMVREKAATSAVPGTPGTSMEQPPRGAIRRSPRLTLGVQENTGLENPASPESSVSPEGAPADQVPPSPDQPPPSADQSFTRPDQQSSSAMPAADASTSAFKTSEQMIQDLQRMYEQRKQLQQQSRKQPGPAPNSPPTPN